ncbi:centrosomal protein of 95 kDa isoform X1 [Hydra vulgaris]|uniref:centrosomal protein of 95 kDa isoform X1 n=1 Tax=Hydra vulgaris TaxID=6087 RepID=UPI001F5E58D1|nr:centrosomal protein of 95 kDa isoform X3 [Hydra vulgaris]
MAISKSDDDLIGLANNIVDKLNLSPSILTINQCNHFFFVQVYESILGEKPPGLNSSPVSIEDQIHNVQVVVDSLATDVLDMDLSHIDVQGIVQQNKVQVKNLLEVFDGLLDCLLEELNYEDNFYECTKNKGDDQTKINNSNQNDLLKFPLSGQKELSTLTEEHEMLSDTVFQEDSEKSFPELKHEASNPNNFENYSWLRNGESTNELINECTIGQHIKDKSSKSNENYDQKNSSSTHWSSILNKTSACESLSSEIKEIGMRPRKPLGVEKKRIQKEKNVQLHSHTHHHYHHKANDSSYSSSSTSIASLNPQETDEMSLDSLVQQNSSEDTFSSDHQLVFFKNFANNKISKKVQTSLLNLVDSAVQTESTSTYSDFQKNISCSDVDKNTRLKNLAEVHDRLKKLRDHFPQHSNHFTQHSEKNVLLTSNDNQSVEQKSNLKSNNQKKEHKVSFAFKGNYRRSSFSDSEIYCSTTPAKLKKIKMKDPLTKKIEECLRKKDYNYFESFCLENTNSNDSSSDNVAERDYKALFKDKENLNNFSNIYRDVGSQNCLKEKGLNKKQNFPIKYTSKRPNVVTNKRKKVDGGECSSLETTVAKQKKHVTQNKFTYQLNNKHSCRPVDKIKSRKRSASTSPVGQRKVFLPEDEILPIMEEEFPFLPLSPHAAKLMWKKQLLHLSSICKQNGTQKKTKTQVSIEEAHRKQEALSKLLNKEIEHNKRLKDHTDMQQKELQMRKKLQERRQTSARARRYYDEFVTMNRARMLKRDFKEEKIFKDLFQEGLDLQKQQIREMKKYAEEMQEKKEIKQQNEIESLENYYRDQLSMLADTIAREKEELEIRQRAQTNVLLRMRTEMRKRMERELRTVQSQLTNNNNAIFFRKLDADSLRKRFQRSVYKSVSK